MYVRCVVFPLFVFSMYWLLFSMLLFSHTLYLSEISNNSSWNFLVNKKNYKKFNLFEDWIVWEIGGDCDPWIDTVNSTVNWISSVHSCCENSVVRRYSKNVFIKIPVVITNRILFLLTKNGNSVTSFIQSCHNGWQFQW